MIDCGTVVKESTIFTRCAAVYSASVFIVRCASTQFVVVEMSKIEGILQSFFVMRSLMLSIELTLRQSKKVLFTLTGTRTSYIILITVALICSTLEHMPM